LRFVDVTGVAAAPRVTFSRAYGDHMVLQRAPLRALLWGRCDECADGETVALEAVAEGGSAVAAKGTATGDSDFVRLAS
jgi:hypothetical protein